MIDNTFNLTFNEKSITSGLNWKLISLQQDVVFTFAEATATVTSSPPSFLGANPKIGVGPGATEIAYLKLIGSDPSGVSVAYSGQSVNVTGLAGDQINFSWVETQVTGWPALNPSDLTIHLSGYKL